MTTQVPLISPPTRPPMAPLNSRGRGPRLALAVPGATPPQSNVPTLAPPVMGAGGRPQLRLATPSAGPPSSGSGDSGKLSLNTSFGSNSSVSNNSQQYSALGLAMQLKTQIDGMPENGDSSHKHGDDSHNRKADVDQSTLDVEDLDNEGWRIAQEKQRIVELGSLGEGAGGAVTKCKLKDGKTIFAMKVRELAYPRAAMDC